MDGKEVADEIRSSLKASIKKYSSPPGLAIVFVGDSESKFMGMKKLACAQTGISCFPVLLKGQVTQEDVIERIQELNNKSNVHGIHLELPLPPHVKEEEVRQAIDPDKDVDGMHPLNTAKLSQPEIYLGKRARVDFNNLSSVPFSIPPTPQGCMELLDHYNTSSLKGKNAVVVGRSNLVGIPMSRLLSHRGAKVSIVARDSTDPASIVKNADILIVAVGKANFVKASWIKRGCIIIDVGINRVPSKHSKNGYILVGDVDHQARKVAYQMTPVGTVGQVTIAMLLRNTANCYKQQQKKKLHASF